MLEAENQFKIMILSNSSATFLPDGIETSQKTKQFYFLSVVVFFV